MTGKILFGNHAHCLLRTARLIVVTLCLYSGCRNGFSWELFERPPEYVGDQIPTNILAALSAVTKIWFPTNAVPLGLSEHHGQDPFVELKVQIPKQTVPEFLKKSPFGVSELPENKRYVSNNGVKWWTPNSAAHYQSSEMTLTNRLILSILVNMDGSRNAIVYINVWSH